MKSLKLFHHPYSFSFIRNILLAFRKSFFMSVANLYFVLQAWQELKFSFLVVYEHRSRLEKSLQKERLELKKAREGKWNSAVYCVYCVWPMCFLHTLSEIECVQLRNTSTIEAWASCCTNRSSFLMEHECSDSSDNRWIICWWGPRISPKLIRCDNYIRYICEILRYRSQNFWCVAFHHLYAFSILVQKYKFCLRVRPGLMGLAWI